MIMEIIIAIIIILFVFIAMVSRENFSTALAPWIRHKTPIPLDTSLTVTKELAESVDPGGHIVCQNSCKGSSDMQLCIDICLQKRWTSC